MASACTGFDFAALISATAASTLRRSSCSPRCCCGETGIAGGAVRVGLVGIEADAGGVDCHQSGGILDAGVGAEQGTVEPLAGEVSVAAASSP